MPEMFVNPLPNLNIRHFLQFDFPVEGFNAQRSTYRAPQCLPNVNLEAPGVEEMYGLLGNPAREQGHPTMREYPYPEAEDPGANPYQDQVLDIDRQILINHTGRLSGTFAKYLAHDTYRSKVSIYAHPVTPTAGGTIQLGVVERPLTAQAPLPNVWFWKDPATRDELLFTAHFIVNNPVQAGLRRESIYKLICKWEFWDYSGNRRERMPISGFNEAVAFEVISRTEDL